MIPSPAAAFQPYAGGVGAVSITVTGTSANVAVPKAEGQQTVRLFNSGPNVAFVRFGVGAQTAVATDMALAPNSVEVFSLPEAVSNSPTAYVAAIAGAAGNTLYIVTGNGA